MIEVRYIIRDSNNRVVANDVIHFWGAPAAAHQMQIIEDALSELHTVTLLPFETNRVVVTS